MDNTSSMDRKLLGLIAVLVVVLVAFYINYQNQSANLQKPADLNLQELDNENTPTTMPDSTTQTNNSQQADTSGLVVEDISIGQGNEVKLGDTVVMHYKGTLENGQQFDSSYDRGEPFSTKIGVGAVIEGWDKGVPGMKVGGKRKLTIPADLGYGAQQVGTIPPNSTLIFDVELLEIK